MHWDKAYAACAKSAHNPCLRHHFPPLSPTVDELVKGIQAQGLNNIGTVWASQGPQATAAQLHQLGEANAAALFAQLGPDAIATLLRSCGPDFAPQLFVALGAPFAGGLLRYAGTDFSAGLFAALGLDFLVPMLHFMGAEYLSQMMNAAGPETAAGTFKVRPSDHNLPAVLQRQWVVNVPGGDCPCEVHVPCCVSRGVLVPCYVLCPGGLHAFCCIPCRSP